MSELLDYIVYMTYDLHGQWDAGNQWSSPGCPTGNCLRSHINRTETLNSLSMITKAGVPSHKILVGVTSYGRSFQKNSRTQLYQRYELGGTTDWAVDLVSFLEPPSYSGGLGWPRLKTDIQAGRFYEQISCDAAELTRTGTWVTKSCTIDEVSSWTHYTPKERWDALDCQHAWNDAVSVWQTCHEGQGHGISFTKVISEFIHGIQNSVSRALHWIKGV